MYLFKYNKGIYKINMLIDDGKKKGLGKEENANYCNGK